MHHNQNTVMILYNDALSNNKLINKTKLQKKIYMYIIPTADCHMSVPDLNYNSAWQQTDQGSPVMDMGKVENKLGVSWAKFFSAYVTYSQADKLDELLCKVK